MTYPLSENRVKLFFIGQQNLILLFNALAHPDILYRAQIEGIPEDAVVVAARTSIDPMGIEFLVYHPSFDLVPLGEQTPRGQQGFSTFNLLELVKRDEPDLLGNTVYDGTDGSTWRKRPSLL